MHTKPISELFRALDTSEHGLTSEEAIRRHKERGPNKLPEAKTEKISSIFFRQFKSPLIYILLGAASLIAIMGETIDALIILFVLIFNAVVGTIQEGRAQNTLLALKKFAETKATVLRDGSEIIIPDTELVVGDILIIQEGEKIPADARILVSRTLKIDESALTGESVPVHKIADVLDNKQLKPHEQRNMVFKGTHVASGSAVAVVVRIGTETTLGKIAEEIATEASEIPLQANIRYLSRAIIYVVTAVSLILFVSGVLLNKPMKDMFGTVVSLAVSVIPEGLPIVITLVLATGVWRMSKRNALVKRLQAVEALGQARVIAVDKTGTITKNEMIIEKVYVDEKIFEVGGSGYEPKGEISLNGQVIDAANHPELLFAGKIAALCANARVIFDENSGLWNVSGDPTEAAMKVLAEKLGFHKDDLERESPLISEIPFSYELKYHATLHQDGKDNLLTVVGAPETIIDLSKKIRKGGKNFDLSTTEKEEIEKIFLSLSREGLRVVGVAELRKKKDVLSIGEIENLTFVGFFGMKDGLRPGVIEAAKKARDAGIKVVMITGDHKVTALAIAEESGIYKKGDSVLTGKEVDALSIEELGLGLANTSVFARVTPEHKLKIIKAYRQNGEIIAMTGDGVNDAPSLVAADLGVSMGKVGTEVAKEASDIVLLDDNFGSIVSAIEEGRSIYKTIKKVILYLFSTSAGEVFVIAGAIFLGLPLPLLPAQIIWLNFVTDGFLTVALAMEPKDKNLLSKNFEKPKKYFVDSLMTKRIILMALPMAIGSIYLFNSYLNNPSEIAVAKSLTVCMTLLAVFQWLNAWNCRSEEKSIFKTNMFTNGYLLAAMLIVIVLQFLAVYNPFFQKILRTSALNAKDWLIIVLLSLSVVAVEEVRKYFYRRSLATSSSLTSPKSS